MNSAVAIAAGRKREVGATDSVKLLTDAHSHGVRGCRLPF
jgi:hypothetical protein